MAATKPVSDFTSFKYYTRIKQAVAYEIHTLSDFVGKRLSEREVEKCRELMVKLAEDRFVLAVVGQFKRGKSSLMNAIIGRDILPTGVLPHTSAITVLKYGPRDKLTILRKGTASPEEVPILKIAEYVTEKGNPGNSRKVACATLELPVQFLRRGLEFVDTPGIGSAIEANTATTYDFLPGSDAVVFVTSVETPLTLVETDFLESIQQHVRKIFFVVNKIDLTLGDERQKVMEFISNSIKQKVQAEGLRIFPVSATMALASILEGKEERYEKSGLKKLQEALSDFLAAEKSSVFLVSVLDKVLSLTGKALSRIKFLKLAANISQEETQEKTAALENRFRLLREARSGLLIQAGERIVSKAEERISSEITSFRARENDALAENLYAVLSQSRWELYFRLVRQFAENALQQLNRDLDEWSKLQIERLNFELLEMFRNEWVGIARELRRISIYTAEILPESQAYDPVGATAELDMPIDRVLTQPISVKLNWKPKVSLLKAFLPVNIVKSSTGKRLRKQIYGIIAGCAYGLEDILLKDVQTALHGMQSEMEKRAAEIESRIIQAFHGKRLLRGIDGRWQAAYIDADELATEIETLGGIEKKLKSIRARVLQQGPTEAGRSSLEPETQPNLDSLFPPPEQATLEESIKRVAEVRDEVDLIRDLETRGCVVCNRMIDAATHFFANWQYLLSTKESAQLAYAASLGFCSLHTWQLEAMASPQGLSLGFSALMERLSDDLIRIAASEIAVPQKSIQALVQDSSRCNVCSLVRDAENMSLGELTGLLLTEEGRKVYSRSQGVCLRHLGLLAADLSSKEGTRFLLNHAALRFFEISEDMRNYSLKRDALRGNMINEDEKDAYLRGIIHTVGAKGVCFPWELGKEA